jgi:solute carrier family 35 protein F1/2
MSNMDIVDVKSKGSDGSIINELHSGVEEDFKVSKRPQIVYSSPRAFARSFAARWQSLWTRQFILSLIAGQVVSLCITCTNVTTTELVSRGWTLSTTQNIFL